MLNLGDKKTRNYKILVALVTCLLNRENAGADPGFDQGGGPDRDRPKLPFWGLSFVEFWCWGLIFGGQGGPGPPGPPWIRPWNVITNCTNIIDNEPPTSGLRGQNYTTRLMYMELQLQM